jgi:hypothetical protein
MTLHKNIGPGNIHVVYQWTYADATARGAATGFTSDDVGKIALQSDNTTLWLLTETTPTWVQLTGAGSTGTTVDSVNGATGTVVLDPDDLDDSATTHKFTSAADQTKLAGIEAGADVTAPSNVAAAGAVMTSDTDASGYDFVLNEADLASNSATKLPTQQSIKSYVDAAVMAAGSYTDEQARDAIGSALVGSNGITITPNDAGDTIAVEGTWQKIALTWIIDEGDVPTTGFKQWLVVPVDCTIDEHYLLADQAGSIVIDVWKDSYANYPPTVADTITASAKPTLSSAAKAHDATLTGWSKTLATGDIIGINVDSASTLEKVTFALIATRSS